MWRLDQQEPFGNNVADENPSGLGAFDLPLRLPGQYFDKETNFHYNMGRDYSPEIGRYIESDPIGLRGGLNTYAYVSNDPLRFIDPAGLVRWKGTVLSGSAGWGPANVGMETYTLVSDCACGFLYIVRVRAKTHPPSGFSLSTQGPYSYTGTNVTFEDSSSCPNPDVLNGPYAKGSVGFAAGPFGYSYSAVTLGRARSVGGAWQVGLEIPGFTLVLTGSSEVISKTKGCC